MKRLILTRTLSDQNHTLGRMKLETDGISAVSLCTLELPWKDNKKSVSCIPQGDYVCKPIIRPSGKWAAEVQNVKGRSHILIHSGNYTTDIEGCILVGLNFDDINGDTITDVTGSVSAMSILRFFFKGEDEIPLRITGNIIPDKSKTI